MRNSWNSPVWCGVICRRRHNSTVWRILLAANGGVVPVRSGSRRHPDIQEDAEVRVRAVCLYQFNQRRQVLSPILTGAGRRAD
jgi:hypothetical protein